MGLKGIGKRYPFLDRDGNPLDIEGRQVVDQSGKVYKEQPAEMTSVIIISAERGNDTRACVESLFENTKEPFEVILSDVGSGSDTKEILTHLEDRYTNVHVVYNKEGSGTTGQRNQGVHLSRGKWLVFMDNDVLALPGWLKGLVERAKSNPVIGMVGAKLLTPDSQKVYYCGIHAVSLERNGRIYGIGLDKEGEKGSLGRYDDRAIQGGIVPWYTTTTILIKREVFFSFDGFDDIVKGRGIFIANEDKDLSLNVRKMGYEIIYQPESETIHNHDYSKVNRKDKYHRQYRLRMKQIEKDTLYFVKKWNLEYMLEKLPHEDNTKRLVGDKLIPAQIDFSREPFRTDLVRVKPTS
jgi:GT2 family glycosyltransferase